MVRVPRGDQCGRSGDGQLAARRTFVWIPHRIQCRHVRLQTIDVLTFNQSFWPLVSLNWTTQLASIGLAGAALGRALTEDDALRVYCCIGLLYAQCLFTASQFSVTLSTLWRHASTESSVFPTIHVKRAALTRRGSV